MASTGHHWARKRFLVVMTIMRGPRAHVNLAPSLAPDSVEGKGVSVGKRNGETTIADVARVAGVSPATVSRVMNDRFVGEPAVASRVHRVAAELNYRPSPLARSLALGKTRTIAFVVPDLANPAFQAVLSSLSKAAAREGYRVLIADSAEHSADEEQIARDIRRRCDSIVLCAPRMPEDRLAVLEEELAPVVLINRSGSSLRSPSVSVDYATGIVALAQFAYEQGHRRYAYVEGPSTSMSQRRRLAGLARFSDRRPEVEIVTVPGGVSSVDGLAATESLLSSGASVALAYNDLVAIGLLEGLRLRGLDVPRDMSVLGFDDIPFSSYANLTTATVPYESLGEEAWRRLHAIASGEMPAGDLELEPGIRVRGSVGRPR
mgnify:CR=1 FL=1|jgi:LacI family transcriptional regulator